MCTCCEVKMDFHIILRPVQFLRKVSAAWKFLEARRELELYSSEVQTAGNCCRVETYHFNRIPNVAKFDFANGIWIAAMRITVLFVCDLRLHGVGNGLNHHIPHPLINPVALFDPHTHFSFTLVVFLFVDVVQVA